MGQCVSSSNAGAGSSDAERPDARCQTPGCQRVCDPGSKSRYCAQHAVCRRQGCVRPRYRKGPYCQEHMCRSGPSTTYEFTLTPGPDTCRVSRCPNNQAKLHDARFTNHLCWDHQPPEVQDAYLLGYLFGEEDIHVANANEPQQQQQQRSRRKRSRQKPKSAPAATQPTIVAEPRDQVSEDPSSSSDDVDIIVAAHQLSTIGEEPEREDAMRSTQKSRQEKPGTAPGTAPGTPTARRSQKTVHFADPAPRASIAAEKPFVETTADTWVAEPLSSSATARLRTSHHRRSLDGRPGYRSSPKTSGSLAAPAANNRERRHSTGSAPKSADVKRATRTRASR
ncbi:uncharacterized protein BDZ83DRAFT_722190 [Colletotrichum acutatum]|uniref:Uncharacterized protein n=1 Tax=Glomerella acutata TaxID=27357 RepID=A0AAD8UGP6_GLOAC|nr:uncharacterized protein BDZ83DRAFT_722190 [Colletotrichum acutatum]KAK1719356.1 hypothetical protein BDZ83DRAFT_722190 [Colletotrichum acutatum]